MIHRCVKRFGMPLAIAASLVLATSAANADVLAATAAGGVNNAGGLGGSGDHFHTDVGRAAGVNYSFGEEGRGIAEFDVSGIAAFTSATLSFRVSAFLDDYGTSTPFVDPIDVLGYLGNNDVAVSDFESATLGLIGRFATAGSSIGDVFSFDVTSALQAALAGGTQSLGILFDPVTQSAFDNAIRFDEISITTSPTSSSGPSTAAVPEPATSALLGLGVAGAVLSRRRASAWRSAD